jgi:predicted ester cyclase
MTKQAKHSDFELIDAEAHARLSAQSLAVIRNMEAALVAGSDDMHAHFHDSFRWIGNQGCGIKRGVSEFRRNWQLPLRAAFTNRDYKTDRFMADGEWVSCFGHIEATHSGTFMDIPPTGKRVKIHYTDFWHVRDGKIADNWVTVDFASVLAQLGLDVFGGHGWEHFDDGTIVPPTPAK